MVSGINGVGCNSYDRSVYNMTKAPFTPYTGSTIMSYENYQKKCKEAQKVGFWEGLKAFGKGLIKPIKNIIEHPIKSTLMIGAAATLIVATGGAATPLLIGAGLAMGGFQIAKGGYKAMTADTKAEKLAAWEDVGEGTFTVGASVAGARAYAKANLGGSAVTKNLGALGKDAGIGSKTAAIAKGLYADTAATVRAIPKSAVRTGSMILSGEATGNLRAATTSSKLAIEHRNAARIRAEHGANSTEYKEALAKFTQHKKEFLANMDETTAKINDKFLARLDQTGKLPNGYEDFLNDGFVNIKSYRQLQSYINPFKNHPAANIAMGIGAQLNFGDEQVEQVQQAIRPYAPAFGFNPYNLNFAA